MGLLIFFTYEPLLITFGSTVPLLFSSFLLLSYTPFILDRFLSLLSSVQITHVLFLRFIKNLGHSFDFVLLLFPFLKLYLVLIFIELGII